MCKEDIRIKRQTGTRSVTIASGALAFVQAFPANPDRVALTVGYTLPSNLGSTAQGMLFGGPTAAAPIILGIGVYAPFNRITIEEIGSLLTLPVYWSGFDGNVSPVVVTEVFFTKMLGDL